MATLAIMWAVPLPVYGVFSAVFGIIELPDGATPAQFALSATVIKLRFALVFVFCSSNLLRQLFQDAGGSMRQSGG